METRPPDISSKHAPPSAPRAMAEPPPRTPRNEVSAPRPDAKGRSWSVRDTPPSNVRPSAGLNSRVDTAPFPPPLPSRARDSELTSPSTRGDPPSSFSERGGASSREDGRDVPRKRTFAGVVF